jgi:hypothetical protein
LKRAALWLAAAVAAVPAGRLLFHWFSMELADIRELDYTRYLASALIGLRSGWNHLYDPAAQAAVAHQLGDLFWLPNVYTPPMSLLLIPWTWIPLHSGYVLWSLLQLIGLIICWVLVTPRDWTLRPALLAMMLVPYPVALGLLQGQVLPLQMAMVAGSYWLLRRRQDFLGGALLVCLALKPQGLQLLPFALLVAGKRRAFLGWLSSMTILGVLVLALIGIDGLRAYLERLSSVSAHPEQLWVAWSYTLARHFDEGWHRTAALICVAGLTLFTAFRQRLEVVYSAGLVGSILASPYVHLYDFMLLFPAAWLLLRVFPFRFCIPLLLPYLFMLFSTHDGPGSRWVLLCECLWLAALAVLPRNARLTA